jgi:hypothetical protein
VRKLGTDTATGRRADSTRGPAARRARLDLSPARDSALSIMSVPARPGAGGSRRRRIASVQAPDQHTGPGMRQRLLPRAGAHGKDNATSGPLTRILGILRAEVAGFAPLQPTRTGAPQGEHRPLADGGTAVAWHRRTASAY